MHESRPCPACRAPTDADGRCAACRLVLATPTGCEPWRTCPEHRTRTLAADGWCNPQRTGGRDVWHVAGTRLKREGAVYLEREVPIAMVKAEVRLFLSAFVRALGAPAREPGEEPTEAALEARETRRQALAAQAAALEVGR